MNIIKKELNNQGEIAEIWFNPVGKEILGFLDSIFGLALKSEDFRSFIPFLVVYHTMTYAEIYMENDEPAFPVIQTSVTDKTPAGLNSVLSYTDYRIRWNKAPTSLKQELFRLALEANPNVEELVEKYAQLQLELESTNNDG
ncbi:MAG: hypothetical protein SFZ02_12435 [bacterium]|nr:hypothetical protein [bacterium]